MGVYPPLTNTTPATASQIRCAVNRAFGEDMGKKVLEIYTPIETPGIDNRRIVAEIFGDVLFHCDNRKVAQALSKAGVAPWVYSFKRQPSCPIWIGAAHGVEIPYVFQNLDIPLIGNSTCKASPRDERLALKISGMWADFARTGKIEKEWPRFETPLNEVNLKIDLGLLAAFDTEMGLRRGERDSMGGIGALDASTGYRIMLTRAECQGVAPPHQQE